MSPKAEIKMLVMMHFLSGDLGGLAGGWQNSFLSHTCLLSSSQQQQVKSFLDFSSLS